MKQATNLPTKKCTFCTTKHRIIAWAVLIGIFVCGVMAGNIIWDFESKKTVNVAEFVERVEPKTPCQMVEEALLANINENINDTADYAVDAHKWNHEVYGKVRSWGCPENAEKYKQLSEAEFKVFDALSHIKGTGAERADQHPCRVIERNLLGQIYRQAERPNDYIRNARIYSKISEDGCPENSKMYKQKALDELQIAEGVRVNDKEINDSEMMTTVDTYKKLQMQNEARKYIKKVEKMVNPGINFIMELQRIIEE